MRTMTLLTCWILAGCGDDGGGAGGDAATSSSGQATSGQTSATSKAASGTTVTTNNATTNQNSASSGLPAGCVDYSTFTPTNVSFAADVMPIFALRCQQCHNDPTESTYYGANAGVVYDKLLNGVPKQAPHLKFVVPNDPLRSYMMAKVEYMNPGGTCPLVSCSEPGCELSAPPGAPLSSVELGVLRSWVLTGADND